MISVFMKIIFLLTMLFLNTHSALGISGKEISTKVSNWLSSNGISGTPIFSDIRIYKDCNQRLEISKHLNSFKLIRVKCPNNDDLDLFVRIKIDEVIKAKSKNINFENKNKVEHGSYISKKEKKVKKEFKVFKLSRGIEKNSVLQEEDIKVVFSGISSQFSFFKHKNELIGRKLNKNLKMDQILHPRHLVEKFDVNNGDQVSIVSNTKKISVVTLGEALNSGNLDDLIRVRNVRSGKVIKGYIKKNKIIRVFR